MKFFPTIKKDVDKNFTLLDRDSIVLNSFTKVNLNNLNTPYACNQNDLIICYPNVNLTINVPDSPVDGFTFSFYQIYPSNFKIILNSNVYAFNDSGDVTISYYLQGLYTIKYDASSGSWLTTNSPPPTWDKILQSFNPAWGLYFATEFIFSSFNSSTSYLHCDGGTLFGLIASGSSISNTTDTLNYTYQHQGSLLLKCAALSTNWAMIYTNSSFLCQNSQIILQTRVVFNPISSATDNLDYSFGLMSSTSGVAEHSIGAYFWYNKAAGLGGPNFICVTANTTRTYTNSNVVINANQNYNLKIIFNNGSANFYINEALVATNTTNLPALGVYPFAGIKVLKTIGSTTVFNTYTDYFMVSVNQFAMRNP